MNNVVDWRVVLKDYVLKNARQNDIQNVIDTIDKFCWTEHELMNIGDRKGKILDQAIQAKQPKTVLELGTFLGYSSLRILSQLPDNALFVTLEANSQSAEIARSIHTYAGAADRIKIVNDLSENVIPHLSEQFHIDTLDFIFFDHVKNIYLRDLKMLEDAGLIKSGTVLLADNVIFPGAPDYLEYIRNNPNYATTFHEAKLEYREDIRDGIEISIRK
ncbi:unnamed protein product [Rotaria magnacalcarata]